MRCIVLGVALAAVLGVGRAAAYDPDRGWGPLIEKLAHDGVPRNTVVTVFRDDRVDPFDGLQFSLEPRESHALYRHLHTYTTALQARRCLDEHWAAFRGAEQQYGVPATLVASIIQVESGCGRNTGRSRIVPALARLAMAAEPENLARNVERHLLLAGGTRSTDDITGFARWRAQVLEDMFYPEVKAAFDIAARMHVDPLEIRGSGSGAFGIPQFLPRSYLWFGVDGDGDGRVSLYEPADAIPSCARYLQHYGWRSDLTHTGKRKVIWGYNHSDAYIDTVLWLADEVESPTPVRTVRATKRPRAKTTRVAANCTHKPAAKSTKAVAKSTKATTKSTKPSKTAQAHQAH